MSHNAELNLAHDPIHGYIAFVSHRGLPKGEVSERELIDHPWLQRLRQIHQLQTAWWVYPSAEHTRFQHVLGVMHLASRAVNHLYPSLKQCDPTTPSLGYVHCLTRVAALLHDVGHGPFGHFFDEHFLRQFNLTHETLGREIIRQDLAELISGIRRSPAGPMNADEKLDPAAVAWLIVRPTEKETPNPKWLELLRTLFCGIYTLDNLDFVLRDAYMSGYSQRAFDLDRLLQYSEFCPQGLTIHSRGLEAVLRFMNVRAELFRNIYFHRTVRAIDLTLQDLFKASGQLLFPGNPLGQLGKYQGFTEYSLLVDVARWDESPNPHKQALAPAWRNLLERRIPWVSLAQRNIVFREGQSEASSLFASEEALLSRLRTMLPASLQQEPLRVDLPRHLFRPYTRGPAQGQNWLKDAERGTIKPLASNQLFDQLPTVHRICRVYGQRSELASPVARALDQLLDPAPDDDLTNV